MLRIQCNKECCPSTFILVRVFRIWIYDNGIFLKKKKYIWNSSLAISDISYINLGIDLSKSYMLIGDFIHVSQISDINQRFYINLGFLAYVWISYIHLVSHATFAPPDDIITLMIHLAPRLFATALAGTDDDFINAKPNISCKTGTGFWDEGEVIYR